MDFSVGEFAEKLLAQEKDQMREGNNPSPPSFNPTQSFHSADITQQAPDISSIEVSNDFVNSIVEDKELESDLTALNPRLLKEETSPKVEPISEVAEFKSLLQEVKTLLEEVKQTLVEMTSVGMGIGAPATPTKKKPTKAEDDLSTILKRLKRKKSTS